jgi:hypothetical protein
MLKTQFNILTGCIVLAIFSVAKAEPFARGPYLGQTPPGPIAKVFAPGLICNTKTRPWEANAAFSADGNTFCFMRVRGFYITENTSQGWTEPKLIESIRKSGLSVWGPSLSPDANSIYFTYATLEPLSKRNIYRCDRTEQGWTMPQTLGPPLSSPDPELTCSIGANNSLYILRGGSGGGVFCAPYENDTWSRVIELPVKGCDPGVAPDESFMVVADKDKPGGYGHFDLNLILRLPDGTWSKPRNLGPKINSKFIEFGPRISPDKKYLFFNRSNGWDPRKHGVHSYIYWVELKEYLPVAYRNPEGTSSK